MLKRISFLSSLLLVGVCCMAKAPAVPLQFNEKGELKIVQFTDVHYKIGNPASDVSLKCIEEVLDAERPDAVVFTGDVVFAPPAEDGLRAVLECVSSRKIPFAVTFGNHDDEQDKTRPELYDFIRTIPYNLLPGRGEALSPDYVLPVKSSDGKRDAALLYCLDSHSYAQIPELKGYAWLTAEQVDWYRRQSAGYTENNGGKPLPALAFFHIPLPEYNEAAADENSVLIGTRMERACAPALNTGMFAAMKESGDVMAVFVGHDHDNDYAVMWRGILLAYGRYTGGNTVYNHLMPNGARVILLREDSRQFTTWVRLKGGEIESKAVYPDSFIKGDWKNRPLEVE